MSTRTLNSKTEALQRPWELWWSVKFSCRALRLGYPSSPAQAEPYVNHVPTVRGSVSLESPLDTEAILSKMTGGVGRENLTAFYRDHFIFS